MKQLSSFFPVLLELSLWLLSEIDCHSCLCQASWLPEAALTNLPSLNCRFSLLSLDQSTCWQTLSMWFLWLNNTGGVNRNKVPSEPQLTILILPWPAVQVPDLQCPALSQIDYSPSSVSDQWDKLHSSHRRDWNQYQLDQLPVMNYIHAGGTVI